MSAISTFFIVYTSYFFPLNVQIIVDQKMDKLSMKLHTVIKEIITKHKKLALKATANPLVQFMLWQWRSAIAHVS